MPQNLRTMPEQVPIGISLRGRIFYTNITLVYIVTIIQASTTKQTKYMHTKIQHRQLHQQTQEP